MTTTARDNQRPGCAWRGIACAAVRAFAWQFTPVYFSNGIPFISPNRAETCQP